MSRQNRHEINNIICLQTNIRETNNMKSFMINGITLTIASGAERRLEISLNEFSQKASKIIESLPRVS